MKKVIGFFIASIFMLTACDNKSMELKTLNCTYESINNMLSSKTSYSIDYIDNVVKKMMITYDYMNIDAADDENSNNSDDGIDGVGTGTDGVTSDNIDTDNNEIVDGAFGDAIDNIVNAVADTVLDVLEYKNRHTSVQNMYGGINGFSVQSTSDDDDNHYTITYVIDFEQISDDDLYALNLSRVLDTLRSNYINQGFTCS